MFETLPAHPTNSCLFPLYTTQNQEVDRLLAELQQARKEIEVARAAEKNQELTVTTLQARRKELEDEMRDAEARHGSQVERLEGKVSEVREYVCMSELVFRKS